MVEIISIRVFKEIVELGSFSKAAIKLNISGPMVSKHLNKLEKQLHTKLINRTSRSMSLTEAGQLYFEQCNLALNILDNANEMATSSNAIPSGELKVSAPAWFGNSYFSNILAQFHKVYPRISFDLHLDNRMVDIVREGFDIALRVTNSPQPDLVAKKLSTIKFSMVASQSYLESIDLVPNATTSTTINMMIPNYVSPKSYGREDFFRRFNLEYHPVIKTNNNNLMYKCALAGMGIAVLPDWLIKEDLKSKRLVLINEDVDSAFSINLFAIYNGGKYIPLKTRSFIDFLIQNLD